MNLLQERTNKKRKKRKKREEEEKKRKKGQNFKLDAKELASPN